MIFNVTPPALQPTKKRRRLEYDDSNNDFADVADDDELQKLQEEWQKDKPKKKIIKTLLCSTLKKPRIWINESCPTVENT